MSTITSDILALVFGNISIIMSIAIELPQLYTIFKTKNTSGTSLTSYILFLIAALLWFSWAVVNYVGNVYSSDVTHMQLHIAALIPAILSNLVSVILVSFILFFKVKHLYNSKKLKISEIEYSQIIFDKQKGYSWIRRYYPLLIITFIMLAICVSVAVVFGAITLPKPTEEQTHNLSVTVFVLNICAATFFESISWPQFIKCMKTKDTSGISLGWAIFLPLSCVTCFSYDLFLGFSNGWSTVLASLICSGILINFAVLVLKIINIRKAKKLGISEWKYTKQYLSNKKKK